MRKNVTCDLVRVPGAVCTELAEVANEQYGFLTPEDARDLDIDPINLVRMFQRGIRSDAQRPCIGCG